MIVVDIETSGVEYGCGIWQIGAIDLDTGHEFFEEGRIDEEDSISEEALKIFDRSGEYLRDKKKKSQEKLLEDFFKWCKSHKGGNFICQHPQFDYSFFKLKAEKYGLKIPINYKAFDLHSVAQMVYKKVHGKLLMKKEKGVVISDMGLSSILQLCGMSDDRRKMKDGKIEKEGRPHDALGDAKLEAECFYRLVYGKNFLPEFKSLPVPDYLKK